MQTIYKTLLTNLILVLLLCFTNIAYGQNQSRRVFYKGATGNEITILTKDVLNKEIFFIGINHSFFIDIDCTADNFLEHLTQQLEREKLALIDLNGALFVVDSKSKLSDFSLDIFAQKSSEKKEEDALVDVIYETRAATSQSRIYTIGDINNPATTSNVVLSGYVKHYSTGEPLAGVTVIVENRSTYATTDIYGFFRIMVPVGEGAIQLKSQGLEDLRLMLEVYNQGKLDVLMKEQVYSLREIVLSAEGTRQTRSTQLGLERVRINRIRHIPSAFGEADVLKAIMTLPGVKSVGEISGGFNVRGGATDQNLVLFNESTIYNPTHLFGLFSSFNPDVVSEVELYKSSIPAKYGGRISSVLEVSSRNGNNNKITGSAGVGPLTSKFHIEGPIKKDKTNFITAFRTTYSDWILGLLPEDSGYRDGKASFNDLSMGISHKIDNRNSLFLYGYYSGDKFSFSSDTTFSYQNINLSAKWRRIVNDKHNLLISGGYDRYSYSNFDQSNGINAYQLDFNINQFYGKANFNWLISDNHTLSYGANAVVYSILPGKYTPKGENSIVVPKTLETEQAIEAAIFISDSWRINDRLSAELGLRYTLYSAIGPANYYKYFGKDFAPEYITDTISAKSMEIIKPYHSPEIRLSMRYMITNDLSIKAGFNSMAQNIHMISNTSAVSPTDTWKLSDANITPQKGWQAAAGLYQNLLDRFEISIEGYYKHLSNYLDYKSGASLIMNENIEQDVFRTKGKAYGVEFMVKKSIGRLNGWMAYTYSRSLLRESESSGSSNTSNRKWYPAAYDKPNDFKLIANYKFTQRFSISMNIDYSTGRPITIPVGKFNYGGGERLIYSQRNSYRIPDYFRMDFAINIEPSHNLKLLTHSTITIGVYNLTGRDNVFSIYYKTEGIHQQVKGYKLSIFGTQIPYINYNIKF